MDKRGIPARQRGWCVAALGASALLLAGGCTPGPGSGGGSGSGGIPVLPGGGVGGGSSGASGTPKTAGWGKAARNQQGADGTQKELEAE